MANTITTGRIVRHFDGSGNLKAAVITAVRDLTAAKVRLSVFEPGGTITDVDNVVFNASGAPSSWSWID